MGEPYYNEAGYERQRGTQQGLEASINLPLDLHFATRKSTTPNVVAELSNVQRDGDAETGPEHDEGDGATRELGLQGGNKTTLQEKS